MPPSKSSFHRGSFLHGDWLRKMEPQRLENPGGIRSLERGVWGLDARVCINVYVSDWEIRRESKTQRLRERGTHLSSIGLRDYGFSWGTAPGCERDGAERWRKGERDCGLATAPLMRDRPMIKSHFNAVTCAGFLKWQENFHLSAFGLLVQHVWVFHLEGHEGE